MIRNHEEDVTLRFIKHHAMKMYGEWRYSFTHSLPPHWMEVNGRLHSLAALPSGKKPQVSIGQEAGGGGGGRAGRTWWQGKPHCPSQETKPCLPNRSLVTILTELPRLQEIKITFMKFGAD
jgi:hypothetical protein